jgi:Fur family zinc uptake transcriptional regulator
MLHLRRLDTVRSMTREHVGLPASSNAAAHHDHTGCITAALAAAQTACDRQGLRLTDLRRQVLELVWEGHAPVKAYDLLDRLSSRQGRVAPPTVYRALDFLMAAGLVHRVASENAFVGCSDPNRPHRAELLLCQRCGDVVEVRNSPVWDAIATDAAQVGFKPQEESIEVRGVCAGCQVAEASRPPPE